MQNRNETSKYDTEIHDDDFYWLKLKVFRELRRKDKNGAIYYAMLTVETNEPRINRKRTTYRTTYRKYITEEKIYLYIAHSELYTIELI